jgi:hypothetical protein
MKPLCASPVRMELRPARTSELGKPMQLSTNKGIYQCSTFDEGMQMHESHNVHPVEPRIKGSKEHRIAWVKVHGQI